jgi:ribosomal protein L7Ae-like RNA K-turn-binding protein
MQTLTKQQRSRIAGYLGIAQKAGKIAAGDNAVKEALKKNKVDLLVLADDIALNLREELCAAAAVKDIPILNWSSKVDLGLIVGKSRRGALAVLDSGFAQAIKKVAEEAVGFLSEL